MQQKRHDSGMIAATTLRGHCANAAKWKITRSNVADAQLERDRDAETSQRTPKSVSKRNRLITAPTCILRFMCVTWRRRDTTKHSKVGFQAQSAYHCIYKYIAIYVHYLSAELLVALLKNLRRCPGDPTSFQLCIHQNAEPFVCSNKVAGCSTML